MWCMRAPPSASLPDCNWHKTAPSSGQTWYNVDMVIIIFSSMRNGEVRGEGRTSLLPLKFHKIWTPLAGLRRAKFSGTYHYKCQYSYLFNALFLTLLSCRHYNQCSLVLWLSAGPFEFFYSGYHRGKHFVSMIWHVLNLKHYLSTFVIIGSKGKESFRGLLFIAASAVYVPYFFCKHLTSHLHLVYILQYSTAWYVN